MFFLHILDLNMTIYIRGPNLWALANYLAKASWVLGHVSSWAVHTWVCSPPLVPLLRRVLCRQWQWRYYHTGVIATNIVQGGGSTASGRWAVARPTQVAALPSTLCGRWVAVQPSHGGSSATLTQWHNPHAGVAVRSSRRGDIVAGRGAILMLGFILDQISLHNGILHVVGFCIKLINDIRENLIRHCKGNHIWKYNNLRKC